MAIFSNVTYAPQTIGTVDTVVILPLDPTTREAISKLWISNTGINRITVDFYVSPDNTSASGVLAQSLSLGPVEGQPVDALVGYAVPQNWRIVARADQAGVEAFISTTQYTEES